VDDSPVAVRLRWAGVHASRRAAGREGYWTVFVRRPDEWEPAVHQIPAGAEVKLPVKVRVRTLGLISSDEYAPREG